MATSLNLTGLTQGTTYEFRVTAKGNGTTYADSAASSTVEFTTLTKLATPGAPTVTTTTSAMTISWSAVTNATGYTIRYKKSTASSWTTVTSTTTSKTISSLTSGDVYEVQVMATTTNAAYVNSDYSSSTTATIKTQLATPSPSVTATTTSLTVSWTAIANASSYEVYYKLSTATSYTKATTTSSTTSYSRTSLSSGVTYNFYVVAVGAGNYTNSANSSIVSGTTKTTLPAPTGLAVARTTNSLTASWSAVTNATNYTLRYKLSTATSWSTKTVTGTSSSLTGLAEGVQYDFAVMANGTGNYVSSAYSSTVTAKTKITLATPTNLAASNVLAYTATLSWSAVANATGYMLDILDSSGAPAAGGSYSGLTVTGTSINLEDLDEHEQYSVSLVAMSTSSDYVNSATATLEFTTDTKLATPATPTLTKTTNSITASWGAVSAAESYILAYKKSTASTWTELPVSATNATISSIDEGATYSFKVMAVTTNEAYENSEYSNIASATTLITLATPTDLTATNVTINSATLSWGAVTNASGYKVEYRKKGTSTWTSEDV